MFVKAIKPENAPKAIGPYSPAVQLGDFVYMSGQIPVDPNTNELVGGSIGAQTHQVMQNILTILESRGLETRHIVKTTVFLTDMNDFAEFNSVVVCSCDIFPVSCCVANLCTNLIVAF
jgi:2-iminobutanoate/2-iminopropanoate deaminase